MPSIRANAREESDDAMTDREAVQAEEEEGDEEDLDCQDSLPKSITPANPCRWPDRSSDRISATAGGSQGDLLTCFMDRLVVETWMRSRRATTPRHFALLAIGRASTASALDSLFQARVDCAHAYLPRLCK